MTLVSAPRHPSPARRPGRRLGARVGRPGCPRRREAARGMELALQDDASLRTGPQAAGEANAPSTTRGQLGVTRIRVNLLWAYTMLPNQYNARSKPAQIQYQFDQIDELVDRAAQKGIRIHLSLTGPAPRWAQRDAGRPRARPGTSPTRASSASGAGVVAEHFAGRVDRYSIWNEPNWKTWLGPLKAAPVDLPQHLLARLQGDQGGRFARQGPDRRDQPISASGLVHGSAGVPARRHLRGQEVQARPARARSSRPTATPTIRTTSRTRPPSSTPGADNVTIGTLRRLTRALDRISRTGALRFTGGGRMPLYLTEYGYFASGKRALPARTALPLPPAGVLDRPAKLARQEPAAVPAAQRCRVARRPRSTLAIVKPSGKRLPAVQGACSAGIASTAARSSDRARRSSLPPRSRTRRSDPVSAGLADARERLRRARLYLVVEAAAEHGARPRAARRGGHGPAARQARRRRGDPARGGSLSRALRRARRPVLAERPPRPRARGGRRRRPPGPGRRAGGRGARAVSGPTC